MASTPTPSPVTPTPTPTTPPPSTPAAPPPTAPATPPPTAPAPPPATPPPSSPPPVTPPTVPSPPPPKSAPPPPGATAPPPSTPSPPDSSPPPAGSPPSPPGTPAVPSPPSNPSPSKPSPSNPSTPKDSPNSPSPPSTTNSSSNSSGISTSTVVGVAVGGLVVLLLVSLFCVCCWRKKKRRGEGQGQQMHYGGPPPPPMEYQGGPYKDDPYANQYQPRWQQQQQQQHQQSLPPPPSDHVIKLSSSSDPPPPPPHASRPPPPPTTPPLNSGSSTYSADPLPPPSPLSYGPSKSTFTYEELVLATDGFADSNLLGQGGFGYVHKGILPNGKEVAVKQLKSGSGQGEREFQAEVEIISRVHHKHLVSLVGYCVSGGQRLLVYEFVPNNTLEFHLHAKGRPVMEWPARLRIALGAAKGLAYLHEDCHPKIIHRDIKASNILLDYKFEAKVADFGLAKFTSDNNTHVSTRVMGTFGYLAPEYASSGKLTDKSDVFSYGVMLLELITGRRPVDTTQSYMDDSLVDWARPLLLRALEEGNYDQLVDKRLGNNLNPNEVARMIACAAACVRHSAKRRPRMSQVVRALEGDVSLEDLNEGVKPGHSRFFGSYSSSDYDSSHYNEDMKRFRKMALQSSEFQSSSQYPTSEYGQNPSGSSSEGGGARARELKSEGKDKESYQFGSQGY